MQKYTDQKLKRNNAKWLQKYTLTTYANKSDHVYKSLK